MDEDFKGQTELKGCTGPEDPLWLPFYGEASDISTCYNS